MKIIGFIIGICGSYIIYIGAYMLNLNDINGLIYVSLGVIIEVAGWVLLFKD